MRGSDGGVEGLEQLLEPAGDEVPAEVQGARDLAVPLDELELGELTAGVREQQARGGVANVVKGGVLCITAGPGGFERS